jgi:hypothetical protein
VGGAQNRRIVVQVSLGKKKDCIFKIITAKMTGGMVQAVECLPHNHEAPSSNFITAKKIFRDTTNTALSRTF